MKPTSLIGIIILSVTTASVVSASGLRIPLSEPSADSRIMSTRLDLRAAGYEGRPGKVPEVTAYGRGDGGRELPLRTRTDWLTPRQARVTFYRRPGAQKPFSLEIVSAAAPTPPVSIGDGDRLYSARGIGRYGQRRRNRIGGPGVLNWRDVTGDGRPDLLRSTQTGIEVYQNLGSAGAPEFHGAFRFMLLDHQGEPINMNPDEKVRFRRAEFGDVTGDGRDDMLLSANYMRSMVYFGRSSRLRKGLLSYDSGDRLALEGIHSGEGMLADLDGSGLADVVMARPRGNVYYYLNRGPDDAGKPRFAAGLILEDEAGEAFENSGRVTLYHDAENNALILFYSRFNEPYAFWRRLAFNDGKLTAGPERRVRDAAGQPIEAGTWSQVARLIDFAGRPALLLPGPTRLYPVTDLGAMQVDGPQYWHDEQLADINHHLLEGLVLEPAGKFPFRNMLVHISPAGWRARGQRGDGFDSIVSGPVDDSDRDWFGCPDLNEYDHLNAKALLADWNGGGTLNAVINTEHAWRFGYLHYYPGREGGPSFGPAFGPEQQWVLDGDEEWAAYGPGPENGSRSVKADPAAIITDFLSYPLNETADPQAGRISLRYRPASSAAATERVLFSARLRKSGAGDPALECRIDGDGRPAARFGDSEAIGAAIDWNPDNWYDIEVRYGPESLQLYIDGAEYARTAGDAPDPEYLGSRPFVGSRPTPFVQPQRDYSNRVDHHDRRREAYARGYIADFETRDGEGSLLSRFSFDGTVSGAPGPTGRRLPVGYRTGPATADFKGNGQVDLLVIVADGHRGHHADEQGVGEIRWYRNRAPESDQPVFENGSPLLYEDGTPIRVIRRTQVYARDLNGNGLDDLVLTVDGRRAQPRLNDGIQKLLNVGRPGEPRFARPVDWTEVEGPMHAHHEIHLAFGDVTGDGRDDLIAKADGGIYFFSREYLDRGVEELEPRYPAQP